MDHITSELIEAAQSGEAVLLDQIEAIDPRYLKVILAAMALSLSSAVGAPTRHRITSVR